MKIFLFIFLVSITAKASDDYYLDVYDSRTEKGSFEVVFEYKGCKDKIVVDKKHFEDTVTVSKWLKSLKKIRDEGGSCAH